MPIATASQTIGPFWHLIDDPEWADLTRFGATGEKIVLTGSVTDGGGVAVGDAAIEIWQTSPATSDIFPGFGRCRTDPAGCFQFTTLKPEPVSGPGNALQAPHVAISIFARGLLTGLTTRLYFAEEPLNETDPVLCLIEDAARRRTLIADPVSPGMWRLDIRLQGDGETVFMRA
jgi:protocatechuate 3,4-dioxygenase, alpha subunit